MPSTIAILADSPEVKAAVDWWAKRLTQTNKTVMRISPGCVKVSCGYGAKEEVIYGKEA